MPVTRSDLADFGYFLAIARHRGWTRDRLSSLRAGPARGLALRPFHRNAKCELLRKARRFHRDHDPVLSPRNSRRAPSHPRALDHGMGFWSRFRLAENSRLRASRCHRRVSMVHTRPVGGFRDADLRRRVMQESDDILAKFGCGQRMVTFAGIGLDLREASITPEELLVELVRGWQYLFDGCPNALRWLFDQQQCLFSASPYPVSGLPTSPGSRAKSGS
jgi:hypothetical protein